MDLKKKKKTFAADFYQYRSNDIPAQKQLVVYHPEAKHMKCVYSQVFVSGSFSVGLWAH